MKILSDIRKEFLDYFASNDHNIVPSAPLIPHNDPTLMFVNAGMVPFKNYFTGEQSAPYRRAVSSQKCVRAGGKHNDLENVGYTARHHTFFEMLGNFSFGDYFKEEAIYYGWELVTKIFGLPADRLLVTVYHDDEQAVKLWRKISGLPEDKIIRISTNDNFWSMGDVGPCGPCSEIFYDHGEEIAGGPPGSKDEDGDRFIEIWNLVFMQYEKLADGRQIDLPKPSIDTGMGLERIAAILQDVHSNYEIDLFRNLLKAAEEVAQVKITNDNIFSFNIIADHLRSAGFLLADGIMPSNEGRGYVLRRIMRRAMRHSYQLGAKNHMLAELVPELVTQIGEAYPELARARELLIEMLDLEEERFRKTLASGLKLLGDEVDRIDNEQDYDGNAKKILPGNLAFKLYDTYGFPLDLTQDILKEHDIAVDIAVYDELMAEQKTRARASWSGSGEAGQEKLYVDLLAKISESEFLGYNDNYEANAILKAIIVDGKEVASFEFNDSVDGNIIADSDSTKQHNNVILNNVILIFNQTPFYGESGGQEGDYGLVYDSKSREIAQIYDTRKQADGSLITHYAKISPGASISLEQNLILKVDAERRRYLKANHTATHLLHSALRRHFGEHITQKGSLVTEDILRFDFSHPKAVSADEIILIERDINNAIIADFPVTTKVMSSEKAIEAGAIALFGEKYGDQVRVVTVGNASKAENYSTELCGGTHIDRTGEIGSFLIISEGSVAAGIRRIIAVTGMKALQYFQSNRQLIAEIARQVKSSEQDVLTKTAELIAEQKKLRNEIKELKQKLALSGGGSGNNDHNFQLADYGAIKGIIAEMAGVTSKELRGLADQMSAKLPEQEGGVIALATNDDGKAGIVVAFYGNSAKNYDAVAIVREIVPIVGGKGGGGKPHMAQAGGPDGDKVAEVISKLKQIFS